MADARDVLDSKPNTTKTTTKTTTTKEPVSSEVNTLLIKSITNIEEKVEAIDWKLWEIYNIIKVYAENQGDGVPSVSQPQASPAEVAIEVAKLLGGTSGGEEQKKSVVKKLFG